MMARLEPNVTYARKLELAWEHLVSTVLSEDYEVPVDLGSLLRSNGLGPPIYATSSRRRGGLQRRNGRWYPIIYRPDGPSISSSRTSERFTIAHELGHALIDEVFALRPARSREYWALERLCDRFAAALLVPQRHIQPVAEGIMSPQDFTDVVVREAAVCNVSLAVSARCLVDFRQGLACWGIREINKEFVVQWAAENPTVLGLNPRTHIRDDSSLYVPLRATPVLVGLHSEFTLDSYAARCERMSPGFLIISVMGSVSESVEDVSRYVV